MRRNCPICGADSVRLSLYNVKRRRQVTCHACGGKVEIAVPGGPYHAITLTVAILGSLVAPLLIVMIFTKQWATMALAIVLLFALIFASNEFLNRRVTVQRAPEPDPDASPLRRWFRD
jgi:uncharacterized protein (DUF983 family)